MAKIVILGAGLTGLSTAYHLEQLGYSDYQIFEQAPGVGGLCRSVTQDGFTFDYTGHLLHISDPYFKEFIQRTIGFDELLNIDRKAAIYSHATYTPYPFQMNLYGLPQNVIIECITGFMERKKLRTKAPSFHQWVLAQFGQGLGRHFFFPYQQKIFDTDTQALSASWTGRFVPKTSLDELLAGALARHETKAGYNAQFWYPRDGGIQRWIKSLHTAVIQPARTLHTVTRIDTVNKRVHFANGAEESYQQLVSTLPLDRLLGMLDEPSSSTLSRAQNKLHCTRVININLGINRPELATNHWVYYPETTFPFYRIGFPSHLAPSMAPAGCSSLSIELSRRSTGTRLLKKSAGGNGSGDDQLLVANAITEVKKLFKIEPQEIVTQKIINIDHAYVIFDRWRDRSIDGIHAQLNRLNIQSVGRYGQWKYASMQEGILDGKATAAHTVSLL